jgi:hypothetical protein
MPCYNSEGFITFQIFDKGVYASETEAFSSFNTSLSKTADYLSSKYSFQESIYFEVNTIEEDKNSYVSLKSLKKPKISTSNYRPYSSL